MTAWIKKRLRRVADCIVRQTENRTGSRICEEFGRREGWTIDTPQCCLTGAPRHALTRLDAMPGGGLPPFQCDVDAWRHVVDRARAGSLPHRAALRILDPAERVLIETHCGSWSDTPG